MVIRGKIVQQAMKAEFFSVMADEMCDIGTTEQMAVCIRHLRCSANGNTGVTEDFLGSVQM